MIRGWRQREEMKHMFAEVEKTERDYSKERDQAFIIDPLVRHGLSLMITCIKSHFLDRFKSLVSQRFGRLSLTATTEFSQCH